MDLATTTPALGNALIQVSPLLAGLVPIVIGLTQLVKEYEYVPDRFIPLVALGLGVVGALGVSAGTLSISNFMSVVFQGVLIALLAMGTFTGARAMAKPTVAKPIDPTAPATPN